MTDTTDDISETDTNDNTESDQTNRNYSVDDSTDILLPSSFFHSIDDDEYDLSK